MEFSSNEILKLIERASGIPDFLSKKTDIELLLGKFQSVEEYLARFGSLDELKRMTLEQEQAGEMSPTRMEEIYRSLSPFLSEAQREKMREVIRRLKE